MGTHKGSTTPKGGSGVQVPKGPPHVAASAFHHANLHGASAGKGINTARVGGRTFGGLSGTRTGWSGGGLGLGFGYFGLGSYGGYSPSYGTYGVYDGDVAVVGGMGNRLYYQYQGGYPTYQNGYYLPDYQQTPPSYYLPNNGSLAGYPVTINLVMPFGGGAGIYQADQAPNLSQRCCCCPPGLYGSVEPSLYGSVDMNNRGYVVRGDQ
jgi:hypothetical protein